MALTREELNIKVSIEFDDGKKAVADVSAGFEELENKLKESTSATEKLGDTLQKTFKNQEKSLQKVIEQNEKLKTQIENVGAAEAARIMNNLKLQKTLIDFKKDEFKSNEKVLSALNDQIGLKEKLAAAQIAEIENLKKLKEEEVIRRASAAATKAQSDAISSQSGSFSATGASIISFNQAIELAEKAFQALSDTISFTLGNYSAFEKALIGVQKTTNLSKEASDFFGEAVERLAERVPVATDQLLDIAKAAGQLGVRGVDNLLNFAETIARVGSSTDVTGEEAALSLTRILNVTSESIDKVDEFASVIVSLGNNFAASESEILRTTTVIAQGIGQFGAHSQEVAALGAASRDMGIRFELAGSAIARSFIEINEGILKGGKAAERLSQITGIAVKDLEKSFGQDATAVFRRFLEGLSKIEATKVPRVLESVGLVGVEINRVIPTLAKNIGTVDRAFALANKEMGNATALTKESDLAFKSISARIQVSSNSFKNFGIELGKILSPILRSSIELIISFAQGLTDLTRKVQTLNFAPIIASLGAFSTALLLAFSIMNRQVIISALGLAFQFLAAEVAAAGGVISLFTGIVQKAFAAIVAIATSSSAAIVGEFLLIVGVILLVAAEIEFLINNFDQLAAFMSVVFTEVGAVAGVVADQIMLYFGSAIDSVISFFAPLLDAISATFEGAKQRAIDAAKFFGISFDHLITILSDLFSGFATGVSSAFNSVVNFVAENLQGLISLAIQVRDSIVSFFQPLVDIGKSIFGAVADQVEKGVSKIADAASKMDLNFGVAGAAIKEMSKLFGEATKSAGKYGDSASRSANQTKEGLKDIDALLAGLNDDKKGAKFAKDQAKVLEDVLQKNKEIAHQTENIGAKEQQKIINNVAFENSLLDDQLNKLREKGMLAGLTGEAIQSEIDKQKELNKLKGVKEGVEATKKENEKIAKKVPKVFDEDQLKVINFTLGSSANAFATAIADLGNPITAFAGGVTIMLDGIQALIDLGPNLLDKVSGILNSLTDLPNKLLASLQGVFDAALKFVANFIPNLIKAIPVLFSKILDFVKKLPEVFFQLVSMIPSLITSVLDDLPAIVEQLISGLAEAGPAIALSLIDFLVQKAPYLAFRIAKALAIDLPVAIFKGLLKAFRGVMDMVGDFFQGKFKLPSIAENVTKDLKNLAREVTGISSQIFNVSDLKEKAKGADIATQLARAITSSAKKASSLLQDALDIAGTILALAGAWKLFQAAAQLAGEIWDGLVSLGGEIWQAIVTYAGELWNAIVLAAGEAWQAIVEFAGGLWDTIVVGAGEAWQAVVEFAGGLWNTITTTAGELWTTVTEAAGAAWTYVTEAVGTAWTTVTEAAGSAWTFVTEAAGTAWTTVTETAGTAWTTVTEAVGTAWTTVTETAGTAWTTVTDAAGAAWSAIVDSAGAIWTGIVDTAGLAWSTVVDAAGLVWTGIVDTAGIAWNAIVTASGLIWSGVIDTAGIAWNAIATASGVIWTGVVNASALLWNLLVTGGAAAWAVIILATSTTAGILLTGGLTVLLAALVAFFSKDGNFQKAKDFFANLGGNISDAFKSGIKTLSGLGNDIFNFKSLGKSFDDFFAKLDPTNLVSKLFPKGSGTPSKGFIEDKLDFDIPFVSFATGGTVPGKGLVNRDSPINDRILSLLSPGEVVLSLEQIAMLQKILGPITKAAFGFKKPKFVQDIQSKAADIGIKSPTGGILGAITKGDFEEVARLIDPRNFDFSVIQDQVWKAVYEGVNSVIEQAFATGGMVQGMNRGGQDSLVGALQPEEYVIRRPAVRKLGSSVLDNINRTGELPGGNTVVNIDLKIDSRHEISEDYITNRLMPKIKQEFKRASLDGEYLLDQRGVKR